ncbi:MAG TPA: hypothetical protein VE912_03375 [Bacteroidales bacterium]|nr:hypothetical protein [Bacteroidales bacterium]
MSSTTIFKFKGVSIITFMVRFICIVFSIYILTVFQENPTGIAILLIITLVIFLLSSTQKIELKNEYIIFNSVRILPFLNNERLIIYKDIQKIEFNERKVNYLIMILPGVGAIKDAEFVFYFRNGNMQKETLRGNQNRIKEMHTILQSKI